VICFLADKTEPGAWNMPAYKMFADPFNTAGLVIDPKMHDGFLFEVHDLVEDKRILLDCPGEIYDLLLFIGSPSRFVVKRVLSKSLGEVAAVLVGRDAPELAATVILGLRLPRILLAALAEAEAALRELLGEVA